MLHIKKIIIVFMASLIFISPLLIEYQKVEAAVVSKVVSKAAKKVAKEAIKDTAVQMSMSFVMDYKYKPKDDRKPPEGYSFVCMPRQKKADGECKAPLLAKEKLDTIDKNSIGHKVETVLDNKIAGGVTGTKWGKFLDWFIPIFSVGLGVAVLDYSMNGEVSDFFDEIAMEALRDLGLIQPVSLGNTDITIPNDDTPWVPSVPDGEVQPPYVKPVLKLKIRSDWELGANHKSRWGSAQVVLQPKDRTKSYYMKHTSGYEIKLNQIVYDAVTSVSGDSMNMLWVNVLIMGSSDWKIADKKTYTGVTLKAPPSTSENLPLTNDEKIHVLNGFVDMPNIYMKNETPVEVPPVPKYDETGLSRTTPEGTRFPVVAPGGLPFTKIGTGEPLLPQPNPDGTTTWKTTTGVIIPEDQVDVGDPNITENPDGSKIVIKQPTVNTPVPTPDDNGVIPPPKTPVPVDSEFPDGPGCEAQLKLPKLLPLFTQISETFPFSIPWDLKSGFDAIFLKMGSEKPEFEYKLAFQGQEHDFSFKIPSFFDNWMPFIHSILLLTFDIGIVYAIYRFMKGGSG